MLGCEKVDLVWQRPRRRLALHLATPATHATQTDVAYYSERRCEHQFLCPGVVTSSKVQLCEEDNYCGAAAAGKPQPPFVLRAGHSLASVLSEQPLGRGHFFPATTASFAGRQFSDSQRRQATETSPLLPKLDRPSKGCATFRPYAGVICKSPCCPHSSTRRTASFVSLPSSTS